jgi:Ca2+/Na+ antiporter
MPKDIIENWRAKAQEKIFDVYHIQLQIINKSIYEIRTSVNNIFAAITIFFGFVFQEFQGLKNTEKGIILLFYIFLFLYYVYMFNLYQKSSHGLYLGDVGDNLYRTNQHPEFCDNAETFYQGRNKYLLQEYDAHCNRVQNLTKARFWFFMMVIIFIIISLSFIVDISQYLA